MTVLENKLVPVDYDGNGTTDLGFLKPIFPTPFPPGTLKGELAVWLLGPTATSSLIQAQSPVGQEFTYANGDFAVLGDGFIPGFGGPVNDFFSGPAPLFPDLNGDGKTDQIFGSLSYTNPVDDTTFEGYELATWFMVGTNVGAQDLVFAPGGSKAIVPVEWANPFLYNIGGDGPLADFNGDKTSDLVFVREVGDGSVDVGIWTFQNGAVSDRSRVGNSGVNWSLVNTNDFNGNNTADLLFVRPNSDGTSNLGVWLQNGAQSSVRSPIGTATTGWTVVDTNDFDGNGTADILFTRAASNGGTDVAVWTMNGTQVTGKNSVGNATAGWGLVDHNDFNGDGKADLLFSRDVGGGKQYAVWLLNGTGQPIAQQSLGTSATGWTFGISGDIDGDKIADLLFYNTSTKEVGAWLLGSNGFTSQQLKIGPYDSASEGWQPPFIQPDFDRPPFPNPL